VQPCAAACEPEATTAVAAARSERVAATLRVLPRRAPAAAATSTGPQLSLPFAETAPRRDEPAARSAPREEERDDATRALGRAIHRLLEWAGGAAIQAPIADVAAAAAAEFGVSAAEVERRGTAILSHPQGARFFAGPQIRWSGNEVSVSDAGEVLRIDRLVRLEDDAGAAWWVLDYKLHDAPEGLDSYRVQLLRYRAIVARAQPGEIVRCAFVTGEGRVVEVA
jgi:ATP-dependent helicase/nuclease subunit A